MCQRRVGRAGGHCWTYLMYCEPSLAGISEGKLRNLEMTVAEWSLVAGHHSLLFNEAHECPAR